jgi:hypothetical protein
VGVYVRVSTVSTVSTVGTEGETVRPGPRHGVSSSYVERLAPNLNEYGPVHALIGPVVNAAERRVPLQARHFFQCALREPGRVKTLALSAYLLGGFKWFYRVLPEMPRVQASTLVTRAGRGGLPGCVPSTPVTPRSGTRRNRSSASPPTPSTRRAPTSRLEPVRGRVVELGGSWETKTG